MKRGWFFLFLILCVGCLHIYKENLKEFYMVEILPQTGDKLVLPYGWEQFFVYGEDISAPRYISIDSRGTFICEPKDSVFCNNLEDKLAVVKEKGIQSTIRKSELTEEERRSGFIYFDGGDFEYYERTELIKWGNPRFWDIFIEKYVLETSDYIGYRMIEPKVGRKYLKSAPKTEEQKNELWNAIIWLPNDIVKERNADGSYSYKEEAGNTGYNPWRD